MMNFTFIFRLGLLSDAHAVLHGSPLKTLTEHLKDTLSYKDGEQDSIYLNLFTGIKWPDNKVHMYIACSCLNKAHLRGSYSIASQNSYCKYFMLKFNPPFAI